MKELTCCFSGHRTVASDEVLILKQKLFSEVENLIKQGVIYFGVGGAIGFDMLACETVIELKKIYKNVRLILVLPCKDHDKFWNDIDREKYYFIKENTDKIIYVSENYSLGCMQKRNRHLVKHSSILITYLRNSKGGTAYTFKYALKTGIRIIEL